MDSRRPFSFQPPHKRINWRRLHALPVDRLAATSDAATAMDFFEDTAYGNLDAESQYTLSEANLLKVRARWAGGGGTLLQRRHCMHEQLARASASHPGASAHARQAAAWTLRWAAQPAHTHPQPMPSRPHHSPAHICMRPRFPATHDWCGYL